MSVGRGERLDRRAQGHAQLAAGGAGRRRGRPPGGDHIPFWIEDSGTSGSSIGSMRSMVTSLGHRAPPPVAAGRRTEVAERLMPD